MVDQPLVELLRQLVAIPSVNPEHSTNSSHTGEELLARFFGEWMCNLGFRVDYQEVEPGRPNAIASFGDTDNGHVLLLESHLDTVAVDGMKHHPFENEVRDGRLYGRGAADCKGAMAAAMYALSNVDLQSIKDSGRSIVYVGAMGEETGNHGAVAVTSHDCFKSDHVIVLEPTDLAIIHTHKGVAWFKVHLHGRSAHGSNPDVGVSAIDAAFSLIQRMKQQLHEDKVLVRHDILGDPTLNIGTIHGGAAVNIVPVTCTVAFDRRLVPSEHVDRILQQVRMLLDQMVDNEECLAYEIEIIQKVDPFETDPESVLVSALHEGCRDAGFTPSVSGAGWCSDASIFSEHASHTVVFGPGSIKQAHASEEYIDLEELQNGAKALEHYLQKATW